MIKRTLDCSYFDDIVKKSHISIYLIFDEKDGKALFSDMHYTNVYVKVFFVDAISIFYQLNENHRNSSVKNSRKSNVWGTFVPLLAMYLDMIIE